MRIHLTMQETGGSTISSAPANAQTNILRYCRAPGEASVKPAARAGIEIAAGVAMEQLIAG